MKVSVIMPAFNAEDYIETTIRSVQSQTLSDWELLVIDDGSGDGTCQIVEKLAKRDSRIRLYSNAENRGTAYSRNRGLDLSRGEYVALLDSDDVWRPRKLERELERAEAESADLVYCAYAIVDELGRTVCEPFHVPEETDLSGMLKENVIGCSTVLLRRSAMSGFRFSEEYYHEDYVLWLDMLRGGKRAMGVDEVLVDYRLRIGSRAADKVRCAAERWRIYRSFLGLGRGESLRYFGQYAWAGLAKYRRKEQYAGIGRKSYGVQPNE